MYYSWTYKFFKLLFKLYVIAKLISRYNHSNISSYVYTYLFIYLEPGKTK